MSTTNDESDWTDCDSDDDDDDWIPETDDENDENDENSVLHGNLTDLESDVDYESSENDSDGEIEASSDSVQNQATKQREHFSQIISSPLPTLVWDNTQLQQFARHQSKEKQNQMLLWTNALAVIGRAIPPVGGAQVMKALDISLQDILIGPDDRKCLLEYVKAIIGQIGVRNIPHFQKGYKDVVTWHAIILL